MFNILPWRILYIIDELESRQGWQKTIFDIFDICGIHLSNLFWYQIAAGWDENEINECWDYLERECVPMLQEMDLQEDRTTFVLAKISSLATREEKKMPQAAGSFCFSKFEIYEKILQGSVQKVDAYVLFFAR